MRSFVSACPSCQNTVRHDQAAEDVYVCCSCGAFSTASELAGFWIEDAKGELVLVSEEDLLSHKDFTEVKNGTGELT